jgi:hypothetical protein
LPVHQVSLSGVNPGINIAGTFVLGFLPKRIRLDLTILENIENSFNKVNQTNHLFSITGLCSFILGICSGVFVLILN